MSYRIELLPAIQQQSPPKQCGLPYHVSWQYSFSAQARLSVAFVSAVPSCHDSWYASSPKQSLVGLIVVYASLFSEHKLNLDITDNRTRCFQAALFSRSRHDRKKPSLTRLSDLTDPRRCRAAEWSGCYPRDQGFPAKPGRQICRRPGMSNCCRRGTLCSPYGRDDNSGGGIP